MKQVKKEFLFSFETENKKMVGPISDRDLFQFLGIIETKC